MNRKTVTILVSAIFLAAIALFFAGIADYSKPSRHLQTRYEVTFDVMEGAEYDPFVSQPETGERVARKNLLKGKVRYAVITRITPNEVIFAVIHFDGYRFFRKEYDVAIAPRKSITIEINSEKATVDVEYAF